MSAVLEQPPPLTEPAHPPVRCACGFELFDGQAVRARVLLVQPDGAVAAKCRCKRWVALPLWYVGA